MPAEDPASDRKASPDPGAVGPCGMSDCGGPKIWKSRRGAFLPVCLRASVSASGNQREDALLHGTVIFKKRKIKDGKEESVRPVTN